MSEFQSKRNGKCRHFWANMPKSFHAHSKTACFSTLHGFTLEVYLLFLFKLDGKDFPPSSVAMEASMLAVIHGHLFVLVCNESLKRVACPNWECLPFRHLYEPNDPGARGRLFIGFPVFYHFLKFKYLPLSKGPPSRFKNIMANTFQCVRSLVVASVRAKCLPQMFIYWLPSVKGQAIQRHPGSNSSKTSTSFPLPISIRGTTIWDG